MMKGLFMKYKIEKMDGSPIDPDAFYFVLRVDTDPAARKALKTYADNTPNIQLANDLKYALDMMPELDV